MEKEKFVEDKKSYKELKNDLKKYQSRYRFLRRYLDKFHYLEWVTLSKLMNTDANTYEERLERLKFIDGVSIKVLKSDFKNKEDCLRYINKNISDFVLFYIEKEDTVWKK